MALELGIQSLVSYQTGGWIFINEAGYYVHRGIVYLQGEITNGGGTVSQSIYSGMPSSILPSLLTGSADHHFTLPFDYGEAGQPVEQSLRLPMTYAATLHSDGSLSLDNPVPTYVNTTPPGYYVDFAGGSPTPVSHPRYIDPFLIAISLAGISWELPEASIDSYAPPSLASHLSVSFADIDSTIMRHDARVHLDGHVSVVTNGATELVTSVPTDCAPDGPSGFSADDTGYYGLINVEQSRIGPQVGTISPYGSSYVINFSSDPVESANAATWGQPLYLPGLTNMNPFGTMYFQTGQFGCYFQIGVHIEEGEYSGEGGTYTCPIWPSGSTSCHPESGPLSDSYTGLVSSLLANYDPLPDWFMVTYHFKPNAADGFHGCQPALDFLHPGGCVGDLSAISGSVSFDASGAYPVNALGVTQPTSAYDPGASNGGFGYVELAGYVARPTAAYTANSDPRNILLWRPGEINSITFGWNAEAGSWGGVWSVGVFPLWENPHNYFKAGDVIDLTGTGWQAPYAAIPAEIFMQVV